MIVIESSARSDPSAIAQSLGVLFDAQGADGTPLVPGVSLLGAPSLEKLSSQLDLKAQGHPIKTLYPSDGLFIIPSPTSVVKNSPHPNAAKLFAEFMIGDDAQKIFPADGGYSVRTDIAPPAGSPDLKSLKIIAVEDDYIERESQRIKRQFAEIFS